ncbi:hypothetical protein BLJAPNOD_03720 [Ensifer sp. M14]|uniref:hypothetical protein n=1 Tax=Ensifer sp. M14 TaxID=2203782 RepID=UPI000E1DE55F|nr:hypothetical protein [Ensifer sp. M14]RDL52560.1 hypothetical protein BLJAPNOD_03720 [Ensifer sp. M14]
MNLWLLSAAALSLLTTGIHVLAGGPDVHDPLLAIDMPPVLKVYVSLLWHATSAVLAVNSAALLWASISRRHRQALAGAVVAQYLAYAGLFIGYGLAYVGTLWQTPQWVVFLLISALALAGLRSAPLTLSKLAA